MFRGSMALDLQKRNHLTFSVQVLQTKKGGISFFRQIGATRRLKTWKPISELAANTMATRPGSKCLALMKKSVELTGEISNGFLLY